MRFISLSAAAVVLALAGCASSDGLVDSRAPTVVASTDTNLTPQSKVVCHKEASMGSNMIHSVCETEKTEAERQALQNRIGIDGQQNKIAHPGIGP